MNPTTFKINESMKTTHESMINTFNLFEEHEKETQKLLAIYQGIISVLSKQELKRLKEIFKNKDVLELLTLNELPL